MRKAEKVNNSIVHLLRDPEDSAFGSTHPAAEENLQPVMAYHAPAHPDPQVAASEVSLPGTWLSDSHVDHAQYLLAKCSPSFSGLQSTLVCDSYKSKYIQCPTRKFIQILNFQSNHWLTVSNIDCSPNTIKVFDSLSTSGLQNNDKFNCQLASLLNCSSEAITVIIADIKQQEGGSDCGLFAIACATSLAFGIPPETQNFAQKHMRSHLAKCFTDGVMRPFPVLSPSFTHTNTPTYYSFLICDRCRKPKSTDTPLMQCMLCNKNFHGECDDARETHWFICSSCRHFVSDIDFL